MNQDQFDGLVRGDLATMPRRAVCRTLTGGLLGVALSRLGLSGVAAGCTKLRKKCNKSDECCGSFECGRPTTRHSCSSSVPNQGKWCCVPPGGRCSECDCCGDFYCAGNGRCKRNPEG